MPSVVPGDTASKASRLNEGRVQIFSGRIAGLDAMRALAVVLVVVYHLFPKALPGGFIGVDVFFVVSGFLITGLLLNELRGTRTIALGSFWIRRLRRLVPALVAMVLLSVSFAGLIGGDILVGIKRNVIGVLTFTHNWVDILSGSQYENSMSPQLMTHTWSLGIEEQFYVLWPLALFVLIAVSQRRKARPYRVLGVVAGALAVISALAMAWMFVPGGNPTRVYFGTDTHLFGLMIGAGLAVCLATGRAEIALSWLRSRVLIRVLAGLIMISAVGALCYLAGVMDWNSALTYRGGLFAVSLLTGLAILCLLIIPVQAAAAERGALKWTGERSYGLYLYHWPVIVLVPLFWPGLGVAWRSAIIIFLTIILTSLSYKYLEQPIRHDGYLLTMRRIVGRIRESHQARTRVAIATLAVAALVAGTGMGIAQAPALTALEQQLADGKAALEAPDTSDGDTGSGSVDGKNDEDAKVQFEDDPKNPEPSPNPTAPDTAKPTTPGATKPTAPPAKNLRVSGKSVTIIGDSVTLASAADLKKAMPGVAIDAEVGRAMKAVPDVVKDLRKRNRLRPIVVLSLATNSTANTSQIESAIKTLGKKHAVVLVTGYGDRSWIRPTNKSLVSVAKKHDNVVIADWYSVASSNPKLLGPDGIHPRPGSTLEYTKVVESALKAAAKSLTGQA